MKTSERTANLCEQCLHVIVFEGQPTTEHNIEDYAAAPHIDLGSGIQLSTNDFGRGVVGTAAAGLEEISVRHNIAQTEVGNLDIEVVVEQ